MKFCKMFLASLLVLSVASSASASDKKISIDGSSTVYPITEAVAEEFGKAHKGARVTVGVSGTGGGFKKFCRKETDISNASREIKEKEIEVCKENGVEFVQLEVAYDAISIVVNKQNTWADSITVAELKKLWEPEAKGKITKWSDIREGWPEEEIKLFGPGVDSGTFDYFTEVIVGKSQASRSDFTSSEDDNVLVQGVSSNKNALGFFGLAYYVENKNKLKALKVDDLNPANGDGPQKPEVENVLVGKYQPLARPLFIYVSKNAIDKSVVKEFVDFYISEAGGLASEVGYVRLPESKYAGSRIKLQELQAGTLVSDAAGSMAEKIASVGQ